MIGARVHILLILSDQRFENLLSSEVRQEGNSGRKPLLDNRQVCTAIMGQVLKDHF